MKIHHIGIIVKSIVKSKNIYEKLGYEPITNIVFDAVQNNKVLFMKNSDYLQTIELLEPIDETSSIYNFKQGYHHICYEIESDGNFMEEFRKMKIGKIFTQSISAPAIDNREVMFACLNNGMFIEFLIGEKS